MTLVDSVADAYAILEPQISDKVRLQRGKSIIIDMILGKPDCYTLEMNSHTRKGFITKSDGTRYLVNLMKPYLKCNCPDVVDLGTIWCKHAIACELYVSALQIGHDSKQERDSLRALREKESDSSQAVQDVQALREKEDTEINEIVAATEQFHQILLQLTEESVECVIGRRIRVNGQSYRITVERSF